jgi:hypothetical protein
MSMGDIVKKSNKNIATIKDPIAESFDCLLVVVFSKSRSKNFPLAMSVCGNLDKFWAIDVGGKEAYFACFDKNQIDAARAVVLLGYVGSWKGVQIFSQGKLLNDAYEVESVLECYTESGSCRSLSSHCHRVIDDPFSDEVVDDLSMGITIRVTEDPVYKYEVEVDRYLFPCKYLLSRFYLQKDHPSSPQDQIQAGAVEEGCNWCPNFSPDEWKKVGVKKIVKEL